VIIILGREAGKQWTSHLRDLDMMQVSVTSTAIAMGLMLSPESLVRLGSGMGAMGAYFAAALVTAALLQMLIARRYGQDLAPFPPRIGEIEAMDKGLGWWLVLVLPICSRIVTAICLSTAVLATAGFVFNEVFLYWFPNFAFASLLLAFLVLINLLSPGAAKGLQVFFVILSLGGLVALSLAQFAMNFPASVIQRPGNESLDWSALFWALVLFTGFDLAGLAPGGKSSSATGLAANMVISIALAASVLCAWGLASSAVVPLLKLKETTVPHMLAARQILGEQGRWIMGSVVLAGTCASVNALILAGAQQITVMSEKRLLPSFWGSGQGRATVPVILMGAAIFLMLAAGIAGDPRLDIYVRAGLLFWLLQYAGFHYSILAVGMRSARSGDRSLVSTEISKVSILALVLYVSTFLVLVGADPDRWFLLCFAAAVAGAVTILYGAGLIAHRMRPKRIADQPCSERVEQPGSIERKFVKRKRGGLPMKKTQLIIFVVLLGLAVVQWGVSSAAAAPEVPRMSKEELKAALGNNELVVIDVRVGKDWDASEIKIKGAVREDPKALDSWVARYPKDKTLVLYCA
jgi:amino acid transporter